MSIPSLIFSLFCLLSSAYASESVSDDEACSQLVDEFLQRRLPSRTTFSPNQRVQYQEEDFIFFLHVPRTAGRTFWSCFLYRAFPPSKRCAKSYDILRLDVSRPDCKLLASHDDYSITEFLPDNFKVITQVRDPVDRVLSAYEFIAISTAREYSPNATKEADKNDKVKTRDVWPWIYLIQLFDRFTESSVGRMFSRYKEYQKLFPDKADAKLDLWVKTFSSKTGRMYYFHRRTRQSKWNLTEEEQKYLLPSLDPYNNSLILPLDMFIEFPMADELIHNSMTFQILGLSNISFWPEASEIRNCSIYSPLAQKKLLVAAKEQMKKMLHISLTSQLDKSLRSIAATLGLGLRNQTYGGAPPMLELRSQKDINLTIEETEGKLAELSDDDIISLLDKYRGLLGELRGEARSRKRTNLSKSDFLPLWDESVAKLEIVKELQIEVMRRRKEKGFEFAKYPEPPDDAENVQKMPLWRSYKKCVNNTRRGSVTGKIKAMSHLSLPDERRAHFTPDSRKMIPERVINRIKQKNWMDVQLFEYSKQLFEEYIEYQSSKGLLEDIPVLNPNQTEHISPDPPQPTIHEEL